MVVRLLEVGIGTASPEAIAPLISPHYKQHNARVVDGPQGLLGFVAKFRERPESKRPKVKVIRTLVDGDYVLAHVQYKRRGFVAAFDLFRVEDGKLAEHWDAGQSDPSVPGAPRTMLNGPTEVTDLEHTAENKALVQRFVEEILVRRELSGFASFFAGDRYLEHDLSRGDGVATLLAALNESSPTAPRHEELRRVIGEGNFVGVQSRGHIGGDPCVIYDLFRVHEGKLAEHWSVFERVPPEPANSNGMW